MVQGPGSWGVRQRTIQPNAYHGCPYASEPCLRLEVSWLKCLPSLATRGVEDHANLGGSVGTASPANSGVAFRSRDTALASPSPAWPGRHGGPTTWPDGGGTR